jgi:hypothetical protein
MKKFVITVVTLFVVITAILILGNIITIGDKMTQVFGVPYVEYTFYILLFGVLAYLIVTPILQIYSTPEFPVLKVDEDMGDRDSEKYWKDLNSFASSLCSNCYYLPDPVRSAHQLELTTELEAIKQHHDTEELKAFLKKEIDIRLKRVDKLIMNYGTKVFIIAAISPSDRVDSLSSLALNFRMIGDIIRATGYRPNKPQMVRQYILILGASLFSYYVSSDITGSIVDSIDMGDIDLSDLDLSDLDFTSSVTQAAKVIPGKLLKPMLDGVSSSILTLIIGFVTKYYLVNGARELKGRNGAKARKSSMKKAILAIPDVFKVVSENLGGQWTKGMNWLLEQFTKKKRHAENGELDDKIEELAQPRTRRSIFKFWKRT